MSMVHYIVISQRIMKIMIILHGYILLKKCTSLNLKCTPPGDRNVFVSNLMFRYFECTQAAFKQSPCRLLIHIISYHFFSTP